MYLIWLSITEFQTWILDIASLLLLKCKKHPDFKVSGYFVNLYLKILKKHGWYQEAMQLIQEFGGLIKNKNLEMGELYFLMEDKLLDGVN